MAREGSARTGLISWVIATEKPKQLVGVQCKLKSGRSKLTRKEVRTEVQAALKYKPRLKEYFIVATSKDDKELDQYAQELMQEQEVAGRQIYIAIWGWDTLQEKIDLYETAKNAFDPGFSPSVASQDRKLDALLAGQKRQATHGQVAALVHNLEREGQRGSVRLTGAFFCFDKATAARLQAIYS